MIFGFCGPGYQSIAKVADAERSINLFLESAAPGATVRGGKYLTSTPGLKLFATLPTAPVRAIFAGDNRLFAIGGSKLYEIFSNGTVSAAIGDCNPGPGPAQIFSNGPQLMVVSGLQVYITDGSQPMGSQLVAATFSDTGLPVQATTGAYLDGYFIAQTPNSQQFQISDITPDGASWLSLDFGQKTGGSDRLTCIFSDHEELWLIGQRTTEVWYNSGAGNFPFSKIQGAFIEQGCIAPFSVVKLDNSIFWLGGDERGVGVVWRMQGYTPIRVSNHAIEQLIQRAAENSSITDAIGVSRQYLGHSFYELHLPAADQCYVYDVATGTWHERLRWEADQNKWHEHPCRYHAEGQFPTATVGQSSSFHYVGDWRNGNIYIESVNYFDNAGEPKRWLRSSRRSWTNCATCATKRCTSTCRWAAATSRVPSWMQETTRKSS